MTLRLTATGRHLPYGITQCYLPPDKSERAPPNSSHAGWYSIYLPRRDGRLSWPNWLDSALAGSLTSDLPITSPTPNRCTTKTPSQSYTACYLPYGITQCYLPPDTSEHTTAGTRFTYPGGKEGWVDLGDWLHTAMVYPPVDGHPSKYWPSSARPGDELATSRTVLITSLTP